MSSFWPGNTLLIGTIVLIVSKCPVSTFVLEEQALEGSGSELCPEYFHLYFNQTGKCYLQYAEHGPCGNLMHFAHSEVNLHIGECKCRNSRIPDKLWTRPLVHYSQTQQCYYLYDQGPCEEGQWIVGGEDEPRCEQIPCPAKYQAQSFSESDPENGIEGPKFIFAFEGHCYSSLTQGFCPQGKLAVFTKDSFQPKCLTETENWNGFPIETMKPEGITEVAEYPFPTAGFNGGVPQFKCEEGRMLNTQTNTCEANANFD